MKKYTQIVSSDAWKCLDSIAHKGILDNFYLAGGTACSLIIGHRLSYDFDFFSASEFSLDQLLISLQNLNMKMQVEKKQEGTLIIIINGIMFSFFYYPHDNLRKPTKCKSIMIASLEDIGCMKVDAIASRGKRRDFIDLYFICRTIPYEKLIGMYREKYSQIRINMIHVYKSLIYFDDAERDPFPIMKKKMNWEEIKLFFINKNKNLVNDILK